MGLTKRTYTDKETVITADNLNDIQYSVIALEDGVFMRAASGAPVVIDDSSNNKLLGLNIYGKSTQASTPTPTAPVDIVSTGDDGAIKCGVFGKNIFDASKLLLHTNANLSVLDDGYTIIATGGKAATYTNSRYNLPLSLKSQNLLLAIDSIATSQEVDVSAQVMAITPSTTYYYPVTRSRSSISFTVPADATSVSLGIYTNNTGTALSTDNTVTVKGLRLMVATNKADSWTKAVSDQAFTLSHTIRGIPVADASYATYTDASGQMWCADEIDLERGVYIQRLYKKVFNGDESFTRATTLSGNYYLLNDSTPAIWAGNGLSGSLCSRLVERVPDRLWDTVGDGFTIDKTANTPVRIRLESEATVSSLLAKLKSWYDAGAPMYIVCRLATPIETPLTAAETAAYKALHTNKPNTIAFNDENTYMSVKYIADPKTYIDNKVSGILAATVE